VSTENDAVFGVMDGPNKPGRPRRKWIDERMVLHEYLHCNRSSAGQRTVYGNSGSSCGHQRAI